MRENEIGRFGWGGVVEIGVGDNGGGVNGEI